MTSSASAKSIRAMLEAAKSDAETDQRLRAPGRLSWWSENRIEASPKMRDFRARRRLGRAANVIR
jgi:hypothetical protein